MLDEKIIPCLKLINVYSSTSQQEDFIAYIANVLGASLEEAQAFLLLHSLSTASSASYDLTEDRFAIYDSLMSTCSQSLKEYNSEFAPVCDLCKRSTKCTNVMQGIEQALLSSLISPAATTSVYKKTAELKPSYFKSRFLFVLDCKLYIFSLYRYFYQFIQGPSPMIIDDNLLLDNIDDPNWMRIIDAFLKSRVFRNAVRWKTLKESQQDALLNQAKQELMLLSPPQHIDQKQMTEWILMLQPKTRKKNNTSIKRDEVLVDFPELALPPVIDSPGPESHIAIETAPEEPDEKEIPEDNTPSSSETGERIIFNYDTLDIISGDDVMILSDEMIRQLIFDAYHQGKAVIEYARFENETGVLFYVPQHPYIFGDADSARYPLKEIMSDHTIAKYTTTFVELAGLCHDLGITTENIHSVSAAYYANTGDTTLHPISYLWGIDTECSSDCFFPDLTKYPDIYSVLQAKQQQSRIKIYQFFELALSTARYLPAPAGIRIRNLIRHSFNDCSFIDYHQEMNPAGIYLTLQYSSSIEDENSRLLSDRELCISIIAALFSATEIRPYALLNYCCGKISIFFDGTEKKPCSIHEEYLIKIIGKLFSHFHYAAAHIRLTYESEETGILSIPEI